MLVFLPGIGEIRRVADAARGAVGRDVDVHPLAGALSLAEQDARARAVAAGPAPGGADHRHRRDVADRRRRAHRRRRRPRPGAALRPAHRDDPADDRRRRAGRRPTSAPGAPDAPSRASRYRLWSKLEHGTRPAAPRRRDHPGRPRRARPRAGGVGHAGRAAGVPRPAAAEGAAAGRRAARRARRARRRRRDHRRSGGRCSACRCTPAWRGWSPAGADAAGVRRRGDRRRARRAARPAPTSCRPTSRSGCALVCRRRAPRPRRPARRRAAPRPGRRHRPAGRASASTSTRVDAGPTPAPCCSLAFPDRLAGAPPRRASSSCAPASGAWVADDDPLATRRSSSPPTSTASATGRPHPPRRGHRRRRVIAALADERVETAALVWDARRATTSSSASSAGSARCASARSRRRRRRARRRPRALVDRVRATRLAVLPWTAGDVAAAGRASRSCGATLGDAVARLERRRARSARSTSGWRRTSPARPGGADLERLDLAIAAAVAAAVAGGAELDELAPPTLDAAERPRGADRLRGRAAAVSRARPGPVRHDRASDVAGGRCRSPLELLSPADRPIQITADLPGLLDRHVGRGPQGDGRPLPQAPLARRPRPNAPKRLKRLWMTLDDPLPIWLPSRALPLMLIGAAVQGRGRDRHGDDRSPLRSPPRPPVRRRRAPAWRWCCRSYRHIDRRGGGLGAGRASTGCGPRGGRRRLGRSAKAGPAGVGFGPVAVVASLTGVQFSPRRGRW